MNSIFATVFITINDNAIMLKKILSISGKPGLYKLISYGKNIIVVESLADKKRMPAYSYNKIISLGDIAIYTTDEEVPLADVMETIYEQNGGKVLDKKALTADANALHTFFAGVLPNYDTDRVYDTDIKKVIAWYNILVEAGFTSFKSDDDKPAEEDDDAESKEAETKKDTNK